MPNVPSTSTFVSADVLSVGNVTDTVNKSGLRNMSTTVTIVFVLLYCTDQF